MRMTREQLSNVLDRPLPELTAPGSDAGELAGLRSFPCFWAQHKLIYGLKALARPGKDEAPGKTREDQR